MDQLKVCGRCREAKQLSEFTKNRSKPDGLAHYCRPCKAKAAAERYARQPERLRAVQRNYYRQNREQRVEWARAYRASDPEKAATIWRASRRRTYRRNPEAYRIANAARAAAMRYGTATFQMTAEQVRAKVAYWGCRCWVCQGPYEALDHVKPLAKGGPHMVANLRPICKTCNSKKSAQWPLHSLDGETKTWPLYGIPMSRPLP